VALARSCLNCQSPSSECGAGAAWSFSTLDIVLIRYAKLLNESAVAAAATVSSKLSARLLNWKMLVLTTWRSIGANGSQNFPSSRK
jgi:hypothetical protein